MNVRLIVPALIMVAGSLAGGAVGHHVANILQARRHNDPEWASLDPAFIVLFGVLFARAGLELGRWILALRTGEQPTRLTGKPRVMLARALARVAAAAIGIRLGFEAGWWTAFLGDHWGSTAQFAGEAHVKFSNIWIMTGSLWGGALGLLGFQVGYRFPAGAAFVGAYLALDAAVRHVAPRVTDLYWGPYPSSDFVALVWTIADLISIGILVPSFAAVAYWSARSLTVACTAAGFAAAAALGAWIGFEVQALYFNDLEWRVLEEVMFFLLGGPGALAGRELGRWIAALRTGSLRQPSASEWRTLVAGVLLRIAMAGVGLWLGAEAGYWVALLWDEYVIAAPFAYGEIALAWIVAGCAIGGALAVLGYRAGHRAPVAAAFLGAFLALAVAPHLAPLQEHLYWGPFPSSDVHAELWRQQFAATSSLVLAMAGLGYVSARWMQHRGAMVGGQRPSA